MRPITLLVAVLAVAPVSTAKAQGSPAKPVLIGLGAGAGFGALLGGLADWAAEGGIFGSGPDNPNDPCLERSCWIIGAAIGGGAGALLGAAKWAQDDGANPILVAGAAGLAVGVSLGVRTGHEIVVQRGCPAGNCVRNWAIGLGLVGAVGSIAAAVIDEYIKSKNKLRVSLVPQRKGFAVGASVRF